MHLLSTITRYKQNLILYHMIIFLVSFQASDPELVQSVLVSIKRHLWYLSEELVPLSLCDSNTSDPEKASIVAAMLQAGRPQQFTPQKTLMKEQLLRNRQRGEVNLHDFAGERSWLLFERLDVAVGWMQLAPNNWIQSPDYIHFKLVDALDVVNDCAERSIKDVTEFVNYAKDPNRRDRVMMVVNHHRQLLDFHNLTREQLDNMDDFL